MSKINFRNLKLKSHEEYLICRTYFVKLALGQAYNKVRHEFEKNKQCD